MIAFKFVFIEIRRGQLLLITSVTSFITNIIFFNVSDRFKYFIMISKFAERAAIHVTK